MIKKITFLFALTFSSITIAQSSIANSVLFNDTTNATWVKVLTLALVGDGSSSQNTQNAVINITSLPSGGANYRVYKTTANGGDFFGNTQALSLGSNTISIGGVGFNRTVKLQFDGPSCEFSSISINGTTLNLIDIIHSTIKVYPNPAVNIISVSGIDNIRSIKVYNALGSLVKEAYKTNRVDVSSLSSGIIFIKVDNGTLQTKKIIKE